MPGAGGVAEHPSRDDAKDQVKARLNLLDLVQQHVRMRRAGREYVGLCPFHEESTPSFSVNPELQSWYCFGCQRGGDIFRFQELIEKTDFRGALQSLAELAGVELEERTGDRQRSALKKRILELNKLAQQYYEYVLWSTPAGEAGRAALAKREVGEELARKFGIGFAPAGDQFATYLRKRGRSLADAAAAGLVSERGNHDFFEDRVVIPIRDERSTVLGFTGRTVRPGETRKYMNTRETEAYHKARVLFALDLARATIAERGHAVLMEGQFDVIVGHQFGVGNALASSGTAFTEDQVRLLKRFTEELVVVFDNDRSGRDAAIKAIGIAADGGLRTRVAAITGDAKDPDEFLRGAGAEAAPARWDALMKAAQPGWEFWIRHEIAGLNPARADEMEIALQRISAILARIKEPALRERYREQSGYWLGVDPSLVTVQLAAKPGPRGTSVPSEPVTPKPGPRPAPNGRGRSNLSSRVRYLLEVLAVRPDAAARVRRGIDLDLLEGADGDACRRMLETVERGGLAALNDALAAFTEEEQDLVRRAWAHPPPSVEDATVDEVVLRVHTEAVERRRRAIISDLRDAEMRGDRATVDALQAHLLDLLSPRRS